MKRCNALLSLQKRSGCDFFTQKEINLVNGIFLVKIFAFVLKIFALLVKIFAFLVKTFAFLVKILAIQTRIFPLSSGDISFSAKVLDANGRNI